MKVQEKIKHPSLPNHYIEFGIATWSEDDSNPEESIRRAVYNRDGVFSPHGSSEVPIEDIALLTKECIKRDKLSVEEMTELLSEIASSIKRQTEQ